MQNENPQEITIEVHGGLVAETPLLLGNDISTIRSLFLMNSPAPTFCLNEQAEFVDTEILSIEKEVFVNEVMEIRFSNGYTIKCTVGTPIMTLESWKIAEQLTIQDKILGAIYTEERGIVGKIFSIEDISKSYRAVAVPAYYFVSRGGNILLPHVGEDETNITFICVSQ